MTKYVGVQNFPLSDNLSMTAKRLYGDYFNDNSTYGVNVSGSSGRADKYFTVHDKVVYNYINASSGQFNSNKVLAAGDSDVPEAESPIDAFDDASYYDAPETPDIPIDYTDADWDSEDIDYIDEMDYEGDRAGDGIELIIDNAVDRASEKAIERNHGKSNHGAYFNL